MRPAQAKDLNSTRCLIMSSSASTLRSVSVISFSHKCKLMKPPALIMHIVSGLIDLPSRFALAVPYYSLQNLHLLHACMHACLHARWCPVSSPLSERQGTKHQSDGGSANVLKHSPIPSLQASHACIRLPLLPSLETFRGVL